MRSETSKFILLIVLCAVPMATSVSQTQDPEQSRILALENAWNQAVQQKDGPALDLLLASELAYVEYDGKLLKKTDYIAIVKSPTLHPSRVVYESINVSVFGTAAIAYGIYRESGERSGKPYTVRERFTDTWIHRSQSWECVASQATLIAP